MSTSQDSTKTQKTKSGISCGAIKEGQADEKAVKKTVPFYKLFGFDDSKDKFLMSVGIIAAIGNGFAQPLVALIFGELIDAFGKPQGNDVVREVSKVASLTGEEKAVGEYKKFLDSSYTSDNIAGLSRGLGIGFFTFISFCSYGLGVWFAAKMILHKGYTGGQAFTVLLAVVLGSHSLGQAAPPMAAFAAGQAAAFKMFETINRKPTIDAYDTKGKILDDIRGDIEFKDVCFSYPARLKEQIFDGFSLFIPSGTTTALVGQSGSGKSTVISLIERFYDPTAGEVLIDGVDLRHFRLKWIRSKIGLVSQEPVLFTGTIKDNIAYGKNGASLAEINEASELANATDFIAKLPQGLDTTVGENGIQLSDGQKQRVAIARAILKNPRILLLDEATSALDTDSERIVQSALEKAMVNRTTVIVAHRLSTIRNANMIAVLHQGELVEKGTHLGLLRDPQGVYSNLIQSQEVNEDVEKRVDSEHKANISRISSMHSVSSVSSGSENALSPETSKKLPDVSIYRLARLNRPEGPALMGGAMFACMTGAILPVFGLLVSSAIKTFYEPPHKLKRDSEFWALTLVILGVAALFAYPSRTYLFSVAGTKLIRRIRLMCFEKIVNMEVGWFDKPENSSGVIGSRLSTDAALIRALVGDSLAQKFQEAASLVVGLVIAFEASWPLAVIVLAMIPLLMFNGYLQMKSVKGFSRDAKMMYEEASQVANDAVGNIRTVASFCGQERIIEMYKKKCEGPARNRTKQGLISGIAFGLSICLLYLVYATSFYAGARLVQDGKATVSDVFRVYYALTMVAVVISSTSTFSLDSSKAKRAVASVFAILDRKSKIDPNDESGLTLEIVYGEIEFEHVNFSYPIRPGIQILKDLSFIINTGKVTPSHIS